MISLRPFALVAFGVVLSGPALAAQDFSRYRDFELGSRLSAVVTMSGARAADVKVVHRRPAMIQELEWRPPYAHSASESADPVRHIVFSFCDDALYQVLVSYDPSRTDGLSNGDVIGALTVAYGIPVPASARNRPLEAPADTVVLAQWDRAGSSLTLLRRVYQPDFELLLTSKVLATRARGAIRAAERLAPARERDRLKTESEAASAARDKTRTTNKAAFRP